MQTSRSLYKQLCRFYISVDWVQNTRNLAVRTPNEKAQNANKQTKIKNGLKNIQVENRNLFAYLHFCVFCTREENKIENKKLKKEKSVMSPQRG